MVYTIDMNNTEKLITCPWSTGSNPINIHKASSPAGLAGLRVGANLSEEHNG